jgi:hypothetical protein
MAPDTATALDAAIAERDAEARRTWDKRALAYLDTLGERAERYAAHRATMAVQPLVIEWALAMSARWGEAVRVHHFVADWPTALLIIRHGEEPDPARTTDGHGWPDAFGEFDLARARELLASHPGDRRWPDYLKPMTPRGAA